MSHWGVYSGGLCGQHKMQKSCLKTVIQVCWVATQRISHMHSYGGGGGLTRMQVFEVSRSGFELFLVSVSF